jgi:hypothetical protein
MTRNVGIINLRNMLTGITKRGMISIMIGTKNITSIGVITVINIVIGRSIKSVITTAIARAKRPLSQLELKNRVSNLPLLLKNIDNY